MRSKASFSLPVVAPGASADVPACRDVAEPHPNEFARGTSVWDERFSRRRFLATSAASFALAGLTGCTDRPNEPIVPYVDPPEQVTAGEPQFFATALTRGGYGRGVIVTSREGRPVKIEGNPDHPASLGAADAQMQAAILDLYDPLRSKTITYAGKEVTSSAFEEALRARLATHRDDRGEGLAFLTDPTSSPTIASLFADTKQQFPESTWHAFDPLGPAKGPQAWDADRVYDFSSCDVIVSFDSDFLFEEPGSLVYARQFADGRRVTAVRPAMNRLYVAEADYSITGTRADHRLAVGPARAGRLLLALATRLGVGDAPALTDLNPAETAWLSAVVEDLNAHRGRSLVLSGRSQDPSIQHVAFAVNTALGNVGRTVHSIDRVLANPYRSRPDGTDHNQGGAATPLWQLCQDLQLNRVRTLIILADNPVRNSPGDLAFGDALLRLSQQADAFTLHLGKYANETSFACQWHVPAQHELECWSDVRAFDGTASVIQPLIAPAAGRSAIDLLNIVLDRSHQTAYETVRQMWQRRTGLQGDAFEQWWTTTLRRGVMEMTVAKTKEIDGLLGKTVVPAAATGIEVVFRPDPSLLDGSLFHNPWLQELPRPLTKIVWGNAGLISHATAARHGLADEDVVRITVNDRHIEIPVLAIPGIADDVIVLHLGYGSHRATGIDETLADLNQPAGVDVYPLQSHTSPSTVSGATLTPTGRRQAVIRTHNHHAMAADVSADPSVKRSLTPEVIATPDTGEADLKLHNRKLIRTATLPAFFQKPNFAAAMDEKEIKQLYPAWDYSTGPQWGMTIDLTTCIGCNACITACQAENNTPSVGPDQVAKMREMHWLRVDSYFDTAGHVHHQPVACMQCENAPCEYVCPVAATTHSTEGLNQMTYNRCVGTRYCSNNCPYKVRRFNFLDYTFGQPDSYKMQKNPDVTVRTRGVMEKCSYCVQRINYATRKSEIAELDASLEGGQDATQLRRDMIGRLQTACQQTCPTQAITFGDLTDPKAAVTIQKHDPRNYGLLTELSTKPRTTYLASITNPNPNFGAGV